MEPPPQPLKPMDDGERRFVLISDPTNTTNLPSRDIQDVRDRGERLKAPPLQTDLHKQPSDNNAKIDLSRRAPSPYSYKPPTESSSKSRPSGDHFLNPDSASPNLSKAPHLKKSEKGLSEAYSTISSRSDPSMRTKESHPWSNIPDEASNVMDTDSDVAPSLRRKPSRYSFTRDDLKNVSNPDQKAGNKSPETWHKTNSTNSTSSRPSSPPPKNAKGDTRYQTDTRQTRRSESTRYAKKEYVLDDVTWSRHQSQSDPQQRSPGMKDSLSWSKPNSRSGSRENSPPPSPLSNSPSLRKDITDNDLTTGKERPKQPPRLSTTEPYEPMPYIPSPRIGVQGPSPNRASSNALPYPVDDISVDESMPAPHNFQFSPIAMPMPTSHLDFDYPPRPSSAVPSPSSPMVRKSHENSISSGRPELLSRHTAPYHQRSGSKSSTDIQARQAKPLGLSMELLKPLPPCPRPESSSRHDDWSTIEGSPGFAICPSCLDSIIRSTPYRKYFKPMYSQSSSRRIKCDFSTPWMRLAWLLVLGQQHPDVSLIKDLASLKDIGQAQCPGDVEVSGVWYGIIDTYGMAVPGLYICPYDVLQIETLFPSMSNVFKRIPQADSAKRQPHFCNLRVQSKRFTKYLDTLVEIDEFTRLRKSTMPDMKPFIALVKEFAFKHDCPKDTKVLDQSWHVMSALPEFTVCEECYEEVILPTLNSSSIDSVLPHAFSKMPQFLDEVDDKNGGTTCQLYSPRMRRVWDRAVADDDFVYLKRQVTERRGVEKDIQKDHKRLLRLLELTKDAKERGRARSEDIDMVKREIEQLRKDWKQWE
jgi:hypothetical protein